MYNLSMRFPNWFKVFLMLLLLCVGLTGNVTAQTDDRYFEATGHWVKGLFLNFYDQSADPLLVFGYPITDQIEDPVNHQVSQYFQRARFDQVLENGVIKIKLAPLGKLVYDQEPASPYTPTSPACRLFTETNFSVCYNFLEFYEKNNGELFFGNPISEIETRDNRPVQYFENVRMEWQPERPYGDRVVLTDLGRIYFDARIGIDTYTQPSEPKSSIIKPLIRLKTNAFVTQALIPANSKQTVYVIVQDQFLKPVEGASVNMLVMMPDGSSSSYTLPATNKDGISTFPFMVGQVSLKEIVRIKFNIAYGGQKDTADAWFRIWW